MGSLVQPLAFTNGLDLIVFTLLASTLFHRFWTIDDALRRHMHLSILFSIAFLAGALLLLMQFPL